MDLQSSSTSNSAAMGMDTFQQMRLFPAPSNLALETFSDGSTTTSLLNLETPKHGAEGKNHTETYWVTEWLGLEDGSRDHLIQHSW